jgi:hypothetical protein
MVETFDKLKSCVTLVVDENKKKIKHVFIVPCIKAFRLFEEEMKNYVSIKVEEKHLFYWYINR